MPRPFRWHVSDEGDVLGEIGRCPDQIKADFIEMFDRLVMNPRDEGFGVMKHEDPAFANGHSVPFGHGMLLYSLTVDHPVILLHGIEWLSDRSDDGLQKFR